MANSKELTEQVMELHKKQTEEMKALEEQREEALKSDSFIMWWLSPLAVLPRRVLRQSWTI